MSQKAKQLVQEILSHADIEINGSNPWDLQVHNDQLYSRVMSGASLALGESYMDGWWDVEQLDEFFYRILSAKLDQKVRDWKIVVRLIIQSSLTNMQTKARAKVVGKEHYDIGNDLYERMLDKRMVYSCGYWKEADTLDQAQEAKLDLICKKLVLKPGMKILDIGCGWGSFVRFAAEKYEVDAVGITISNEQVNIAQERTKGLPVEIRLQDYRDVKEQFDRVISIGMFEHVGYKNYQTFMEVTRRHIKDDGLMMLHTIGGNTSVHFTDPWIGKYIFANSMIPSAEQIAHAYQGLWVMEDWHNFGVYYDTTLMAWHKNFSNHWPELQGKYGDRFKRMWDYYLLSCAGSFRARKNQLWQIVLSPQGVAGGYSCVR